MSEVRIPLPPQTAELLQERCRDCWFARNLLSEAIKTGADPAAEAMRINEECGIGWQGEEKPQESLVNADSEPALAMSASLDEHCPHPLS